MRFILLWIIPFLAALSLAFVVRDASAQSDTLELKSRLKKARDQERIGLLNELAKAYLDIDPTKSIQYASEALEIVGTERDQPQKALAFFLLADASYYLDNFDIALDYYQKSAAIEKEINGESSEGYINRIGDAGYCYYITERYAEAMQYFRESLDLSLQKGFLTQAASMYCNIGNIYVLWGDYKEGLEYHQKALEIDKETGGDEQIAVDLNNIGKIYEKWGHFEEAVKYYQSSLDLSRKIANPSMVAIRLNNLGSIYKARERYQEALDYFQQALSIEQQQGNTQKVGRRLINMASTCLSLNQFEKCQNFLNQAFPLVQKSGLPGDLASYYQVSGKLHLSTGDYKQAITHFQHSQHLAIGNGVKPVQIGNLQGLSESYARSGNYHDALEYLKMYIALKDSVFREESSETLAEFHARFENNRMLMENEALRKDAEWKWKVYRISGFTFGTIFVSLILVILLLRLKHRNSHQSRKMAEQRNKNLELELELRNKELTCNAIAIIKKNEAITEMVDALEQAIQVEGKTEILGSFIERLRNREKDSNWKEFERRFTQVHMDFYDKLNDKFPDLTPNERKLCAFLRLNMTTKDIASITYQSAHSINVARTRLRRKMNLANSDENLVSFLINL